MGIFGRKKNLSKIQKPDKIKKRLSVIFLLSIPLAFIGAIFSILRMLVVFSKGSWEQDVAFMFACSFVGTAILFHGKRASRIKTFLHEMKHSVAVILSGNDIKEFKAGKGTGHVSYTLRQPTLRFEPFIILAPYFFPLLSLPTLIGALLWQGQDRAAAALVLGIALSIDMVTNYEEIHPYQTDLKSISGGILVAGSFIAGANLFWFCACLLWVFSGDLGFVSLFYLIVGVFKAYFIEQFGLAK